MLSVPSCGSAKKACFRACRVLQSRPVPCNVEQRRAINRIERRSCHFLRVSCVASVSVAFCRVARSRAMLSNAVRSAQPRFKSDRCQYRQRRSCHFLGVSVAICRVAQYRGCQYRQRPRTVVRSMSVPAWSAQCQYRRN